MNKPEREELIGRMRIEAANCLQNSAGNGEYCAAFYVAHIVLTSLSKALASEPSVGGEESDNGSSISQIAVSLHGDTPGSEPSAVWKLGAEGSETFVRAITDPPAPNDALKSAADHYRASHGMVVSELRTLLASQPDDARVLVFDHLNNNDGHAHTIAANCILSMDHSGPVAIICSQDPDQ